MTRLAYVLLSPTFGMHQYTADLANRALAGDLGPGLTHVDLITTSTWIADRYHPGLRVHTPITSHSTGFSPEGARLGGLQRTLSTILEVKPDLVHFTGVHAWNVVLARWLRRRGIRIIHTLHDLDPHHGVRFSRLIRLWNRLVISSVDVILVHGKCYRDRLLHDGVPPGRVAYAPLLHLFLGYEQSNKLDDATLDSASPASKEPVALFFGRVEAYKGVETLLAAWSQIQGRLGGARLIIAGAVSPQITLPNQPEVEIRNRVIRDDEALALFRSSSLLVLPYLDATQSALIGAAYRFGLPVIATTMGALPEYVIPGRTGWLVHPADAGALADALAQAMADTAHLQKMGKEGKIWYDTQRGYERNALTSLYAD